MDMIIEQTNKELKDKEELLLERFKKHSSDWGIGKMINNIYSFIEEIKDKLINHHDYEVLRKECNEGLSHYIEFFNNKYEDYYETKRYLNPEIDTITSKYKNVITSIEGLEKNMNHFLLNHNKRNEQFVPSINNALRQMKVDKEKLSHLYESLLVNIKKNDNNNNIVIVIMDPSFLKEWFEFIKTCNYIVSSRKSIYNRAISYL